MKCVRGVIIERTKNQIKEKSRLNEAKLISKESSKCDREEIEKEGGTTMRKIYSYY